MYSGFGVQYGVWGLCFLLQKCVNFGGKAAKNVDPVENRV